MSQPSLTHLPAFQAFFRWMNDNVKSTSLAEDGNFIPGDLINSHLESNDCAILKGLLAELYRGQPPPITAKDIVGQYQRVFCILVSIEEVNFLPNFMEFSDLSDNHLPFTENSRQLFPYSTHKLFEVFCEAQWKFCPARLDKNSKQHFREREILPFISKTLIGKGSSADIFLVDVYPFYNSLPSSVRS